MLKAGAGAGYIEREDDEYGYDLTGPFPQMKDSLMFTDPDTFLTGARKHSLKDVEEGFLYGDTEARLNTRLSTIQLFPM